ncbi:hypothetical protein ACJ51O_10590 [Burkholderia pyrrocinia]|uniref:hypothetical protein n=1 Tax=Burkholderia pyrrocinia TaxID=60550 RepID=UPI0038B452E3
MSTVEQQPEQKSKVAWPWPMIVSVLGLITLGVAYSLADAYYRALLGRFWIEADGFPIDKSKHLVLSVWGALNASVAVQNWLSEHTLMLLKIAGFIVTYVAAWVVIEKGLLWLGARVAKKKDGTPRSFTLWPIARRYFLILAWTVFGLGNVAVLAIYIPVFISIPSGIGEAVGKSIADEMKLDFDLGCQKSKVRCQMLVKDGKEVGRGYVIVQSPTRVAIYLNGNVRQLPVDGVELKTIDRSQAADVTPKSK